MFTQSPGKVEFGSRCLYWEESVGEPGEEGGVSDKVGVHVERYGQVSSHNQEEEHAAKADEKLLTDGRL